MKAFYFMIHWDGPYVDGFISFGETPKQALKALKTILCAKLMLAKEKEKENPSFEDFSVKNLKAYLRSLKRPWRKAKKGDPMLRVTELSLPTLAGFWLKDTITGQHYCNLTDTNDPAEVYGKRAEEKEK